MFYTSQETGITLKYWVLFKKLSSSNASRAARPLTTQNAMPQCTPCCSFKKKGKEAACNNSKDEVLKKLNFSI